MTSASDVEIGHVALNTCYAVCWKFALFYLACNLCMLCCSTSEGVYNDDDTGSGDEEEEEEGDGRDDEPNGDGICQFGKSNWREVSAERETSPYSEQVRLTNKQSRYFTFRVLINKIIFCIRDFTH